MAENGAVPALDILICVQGVAFIGGTHIVSGRCYHLLLTAKAAI